MAPMNTGRIIDQAMKRKGWNQTDLAKALKVKPQSVQQWLQGIGPKRTRMPDIEKALGLAPGTLSAAESIGINDSKGDYNFHNLAPVSPDQRHIPVLSFEVAARWPGIKTDGLEQTGINMDYGKKAFALRIEDSDMQPDIMPGDIIIIDPDTPPAPGDNVIAALDEHKAIVLRRYRLTAPGNIELTPLNPDYPRYTINKKHPGRIIGTQVEVRRFRRKQ